MSSHHGQAGPRVEGVGSEWSESSQEFQVDRAHGPGSCRVSVWMTHSGDMALTLRSWP